MRLLPSRGADSVPAGQRAYGDRRIATRWSTSHPTASTQVGVGSCIKCRFPRMRGGSCREFRACRTSHTTSTWASRPRHGSPQGLRRAQPALRGLLPHPYLDRGLAQRLGQIRDLGLKLLLPGGGSGLARGQALLAGLEELSLPPANLLLGDLLPPRGLGDRHLPGQHAQHDPQLLLRRDHRWSTHRPLVSLPCSEGSTNSSATKSDARHASPSARGE